MSNAFLKSLGVGNDLLASSWVHGEFYVKGLEDLGYRPPLSSLGQVHSWTNTAACSIAIVM